MQSSQFAANATVRNTPQHMISTFQKKSLHYSSSVIILGGCVVLASAGAASGAQATESSLTSTLTAEVRLAQASSAPAATPEKRPSKLQVPVKPGEKTPKQEPLTIEAESNESATPTLPAAPDAESTLGDAGAGVAQPEINTEETLLTTSDAEGKTIAVVRVAGNRVVNADTILLAATATRPGAAYSSRRAQLDLRKIRELGFFAGVEIQLLPNLQDPDKVDVTFIVTENRVVTGFRFENNSELKSEDLEKALASRSGSLLNSNTVNEDVRKIQAAYSEKGFAALVTDVQQEDNGTVVYTVQEGVLSKIELSGLRKTRPSIVRSVIHSKPGDPFNENKIQKDLNRIYDTDFFEDITYKVTDDPQTPGALIVTISVKEKRTGQFSVGLGFDNRSKLSGFVGISESNFRGSGKNVSAQVELGAQRSFNVGFGDRFVGDRNASYNVNLYSNRIYREPRSVEKIIGGGTGQTSSFSYQEERVGGRVNYTHPLNRDRTSNLLFGYRNESVKLFLLDSKNTVPVNLPTDSSGRISALSAGYLHDKRDLRIDPSKGGRELLLLEQGINFLGGDASFTKIDLDVRRYIPIIKSKKRGELPPLVFAGRVVVGKTFGQLPAFEQYFVGGSETVRGYDADEQFGDNQLYGNLELRYRFQRRFQFVAFADAGSAFGGRFSSSKSPDALFGYGVGVRLQTPIGPVRLDLAKGESGGFKTHFGIGASF